MIAILFIAMFVTDWVSFLPRPWLPPLFAVLALITMVAKGLS